VKIKEKTKVGEYLVIESPEALVSLAQMDILEIHTWNTRHRRVEYPDRIILDLDPGPEIAWPTVIAAAKIVRQMLQALELESFVKTTGGKGLHVVVPLEPRHDWKACLELSRGAAEALTVETVPERLKRLRKEPWADYFGLKQRFSAKTIAALDSSGG
jgi:bifunctional non-homologous end joining protein LigD